MVYGLFVPVILAAFILFILCLPCMAVLVVPLYLLTICLPVLLIGLVLFPIAWYVKIFFQPEGSMYIFPFIFCIFRWVYGCVTFWPQVASSPCTLLAVTGTIITILMPISACMEAVFARSYDIRLEWDKKEKVVYFQSRGRRRPIFATANKTQNEAQIQAVDTVV